MMNNKEYQELSIVLQNLSKQIPINWGRVQNNTTDNKIDMFSCKTIDSLEQQISNLPTAEKNYFKRRWFLWKCSQVDEYLFYKEKNVAKNPDYKDQTWDIVFNNSIYFDVKGTVVPKSLRANFKIDEANEKKIIAFYYKNQSRGIRYKIQNRLFIVHHSFYKNERSMYLRCHWKLKEIAYKEFNNLISNSKINLIEHQSVVAKCIFIIESEENIYNYKII